MTLCELHTRTLMPARPRERVVAMLSDPSLVKSIENILLVRGVPDREVPDMIQEAFLAAFLCKSLPESDVDARQYLFGIVRNKVKMLHRKWHERNHEPFDEELHGASMPAPFEVRDHLRQIVAAVPESRWQSFMWFTRITFGESLVEIAREEGVDYATAHARLARIRVDLRRWATQLSAAAAVLLVVLGAYRVLWPRPEEAARPAPARAPLVVPSAAPSGPIAQAQAEPGEATALRRRAFEDCGATRWVECQRDLDEAKRRDPDGEADPRVRDLRRQIAQASGNRDVRGKATDDSLQR